MQYKQGLGQARLCKLYSVSTPQTTQLVSVTNKIGNMRVNILQWEHNSAVWVYCCCWVHVTVYYIKYWVLHTKVFVANLCHRQQRKLYVYSNQSALCPRVTHKRCIETKGWLLMAFLRRTIWINIFVPYKAFRSFSVFVRIAIKHFARSDGINQLWSKYY